MSSVKMKKTLSVISIIIIQYGSILSQDSLSKLLFDSNVQIRYETINSITKQQLEEDVPYIEEAIFDQPEPFMIYKYLKALQTLNSPNIVSFTKQFIVLSDEFEDMRPAEDPLEMKVKATLILFNLGNYSTVDYVFELVQRDSVNINIYALDALGRILLEVPRYSEIAKTELLFVLDNSTDETSRSLAMLYLNEYSSTEFLTNYLDKFINDPDETIRNQAFCYLFNIEYQGLHSLLLERLSQDSSGVMRSRIADSILALFGEPADLKAVQNYQANEQDKTIKAFVG